MGKLVILKLVDGDIKKGFSVSLEIRSDGDIVPLIESTGKLPPCEQILKLYKHWQSAYQNKIDWPIRRPQLRFMQAISGDPNIKLKNCIKELSDGMNKWLNSSDFRPVKENLLHNLNQSEEIKVIIQAADIQMRKLPWHIWDLFEKYSQIEVALSTNNNKQPITTIAKREKPRILVILGKSTDIDINSDGKLLGDSLKKAEIEVLQEPKMEKLQENLLDDERGWDILFFAGHSQSQNNSQNGQLHINENLNLTSQTLKMLLEKPMQRGLKLAIFNSCDGLGLVPDLEKLHIPQLIIMREPVPDVVAQAFLKHFLKEFSSGKSLYASVQEARKRLILLEDKYPCASWLPVICHNPTTKSVTWQELQHGSNANSPEAKSPLNKKFIQNKGLLLSSVVTLLALAGWGIYSYLMPSSSLSISKSNTDSSKKAENITNTSSQVSFTCEIVTGVPTTVVKTNQGKRQFIRWVSTDFSSSGYTPQKRCEEVTEKMNKYFTQGLLYITNGIMSKQPVICVTDEKGNGCIDVLYTLKPGQDAKATLEDLFQLNNNNFASPARRESSCPIYVNIADTIASNRVIAEDICREETRQNTDNAQTKIKEIAQQTTVLISGKGFGNGVIISRNGNTYYVLTANHVVGIPPGPIEDPYQIKTYDGKTYQIDYKKVRKDSTLDLAIVEFNSQQNYPVAKLSTKTAQDMPVYISGWIDCLPSQRYVFNAGKISKLSKGDDEGYSVEYTNPTVIGMSGSPVFDDRSRVIAIHGKPGREKSLYNFKKCPSLTQDLGNNWGISIDTFLRSSLASDIQLQVDDNQSNYPIFLAPEAPVLFKKPGT